MQKSRKQLSPIAPQRLQMSCLHVFYVCFAGASASAGRVRRGWSFCSPRRLAQDCLDRCWAVTQRTRESQRPGCSYPLHLAVRHERWLCARVAPLYSTGFIRDRAGRRAELGCLFRHFCFGEQKMLSQGAIARGPQQPTRSLYKGVVIQKSTDSDHRKGLEHVRTFVKCVR